MNERQLFVLLQNLWRDAQQPDFFWQALALCLSLGLGWWLSRRIRQHSKAHPLAERSTLQSFGVDSLKRLAFPLFSLLLVLLLRELLKISKWSQVSLLELAVPLLLSLALVRATLYVLRRAFSPSGWLATSERFVAISIWIAGSSSTTRIEAGIFQQVPVIIQDSVLQPNDGFVTDRPVFLWLAL